MDIMQAVRTQLAATAGVTALVGNRIHPLRLPPGGALPAITYQMVSDPRQYTHDGAAGLAQPRIQITCWGETDSNGNSLYSSAKALAAAVRVALSAFSGTLGGAGGVFTGYCFTANEIDLYDPETKRYYTAVDFFLGHNE